MSPAAAALQEGFDTLTAGDIDGVSFWLGGPTGPALTGLLSVAPPLDPNTELGADPREKCVLEVSGSVPADLALNSRLMQQDNRQLWLVVHQDANPGDFTTKFILVKIVKGVDV